jgi:hypothetical protein
MCYFLSSLKESHIIAPEHSRRIKTNQRLEMPANAKKPVSKNSKSRPMKNAESALPLLKNIYCFSIYIISIPL